MRSSTAIATIGLIAILGVGAIDTVAHSVHHNGGRWYAVDGDTIYHGSDRIRLLYIDAPEMPGHCRPGRECVQGDPWAAQQALQHILDSGNVRCEGNSRDVYGRTLAECFVTAPNGSTVSINEAMLTNGHALSYHYRLGETR